MDYVPGQRLADCWDEMELPQKTRIAKDLARAMAEMFALTAPHCGVLLHDSSLNDSQRSLRYEPSVVDAPDETHEVVPDNDFLIGPVNDIALLSITKPIPASLCGPFTTERAFLEVFGYGNEYGGSNIKNKLRRYRRWPIERMFEIYDVIRPLYTPWVNSAAPFHFAHADLNPANLMVDPESGEITGVIDWEMAGFRPAWLCATSATWFDDDSCRFVVEDHQDGPDGYGEDTAADTVLREIFLAELGQHNPTLLEHNRKGVELRAMFYNLSNESTMNTESWIEKYEKYEWSVTKRGQFPFDVQKWMDDRLDLYDE